MKIVITGSAGFIGSNLKHKLSKSYNVIGFDKIILDNLDIKADVGNANIIGKLKKYAPDITIHCAAQKNLISCETNLDYFNTNVNSTYYINEYAKKYNSKIIFISSDLVFDGKDGGYSEESVPRPINNYGLWKQLSENMTLFSENNCVVRTAMIFGNTSIPNSDFYLNPLENQSLFPQYIINRSRHNMETKLATNVISNPTPIGLLGNVIEEIIARNAKGIFHACPPFSLSRFEFGKKICQIKGLDKTLLLPFKQSAGIRPLNLSLKSNETFSKLNVRFTPVDFKLAIANISQS